MAKIDELIWEPKRKETIIFYYDLNNACKKFDGSRLYIENLTIDPGTMELNWSVNYNRPSYTTISFQVNDNQSNITRFYNWARGRKFDFNIEITDPVGCVIKKTQVKNAVLVSADGENGKIGRFSFCTDYFTVEIEDTVKTIENAFVIDYAETINKNIVNNINNMETDYIYTSHIDAAIDYLRNNPNCVSNDSIEAVRKIVDIEQVSYEDMLI